MSNGFRSVVSRIQAQVGHAAPEVMKTYSHIRRQALNRATAALDPLKSAATSVSRSRAASAIESRLCHNAHTNLVPRRRLLDFPKRVALRLESNQQPFWREEWP
jgi:hypothetical protein